MKWITIKDLGNDIYVFDEEDNLCPRCSYLMDEGSDQCLSCNIFGSRKNKDITTVKFHFKKNISVSWYIYKKGAEKPSKKSIHIMTWLILISKNDKNFIPYCAELLNIKIKEFLKQSGIPKGEILLCCVPDSQEELYQKADLLSKSTSKKSKITYSPLLKKVRKTDKQHKFGTGKFKKKFENVKGAFGINNTHLNKIKNKIIFLIDDVVTSMASINECSKMLKNGGSKEVYVFSLGRNILPRKENKGEETK